MAKAYKCDICGDLFENKHRLEIRPHSYAFLQGGSLYYDICPNCIDAIQKTIDQCAGREIVDE